MRENWRIIEGGRKPVAPPGDLPRIWQPYRHRPWWRRLAEIRWADLRQMAFIGVFLGAAYATVQMDLPAWPSPQVQPRKAEPKTPSANVPKLLGSREDTQPIGDDPPENFIDGGQRANVPGRSAAISVSVIDGDTFDIGGERIRIAGIDAPETHPARCAAEAELGARATRRLRELLAAGQVQLHAIGRDEDSYGRKLRDVSVGGRSVGDQLIAEGLARPYGSGRRPWCA